MDLATTIVINFDPKVAKTGYKLDERKGLVVKHEGSGYKYINFSMLTLHEFWASVPKIGDEEHIDDKRVNFADKYGPLKYEGEKPEVFMELAHKFIDIVDASTNHALPTTRNKPELAWETNEDGLLCPAINCATLYDALLIAWQLNVYNRDPELRTCLYFKTYGKRSGCTQTFKPTRKDVKHCSATCKDLYNRNKRNELHTNAVKANEAWLKEVKESTKESLARIKSEIKEKGNYEEVKAKGKFKT
jgi:hypothetical protein